MFKKIICATDMNIKANPAIKKAVQLAHQFYSDIILLNVHEEFMTKEEMEMLRVRVGTIQEEFEKTAIQAKKEMKDILLSLHAEDVKVEFAIKAGKPQKVICNEAARTNADLIIMGTSSKPNISKLLLGTTASYVIEHAKIPVLVVPLSI